MNDLFYNQTPEEALASLNSSAQGLAPDEASRRLAADGPNEIPRKGETPWWKMLFEQFKNPFIIILLGAALLKYFHEGPIEASAIAVVILLMAGLGFFEDFRAQSAMTALLNLVTPKATLRRRGETVIALHKDIVCGDVLLLNAGDKVPADARLLEASNLMVSESSLTGESVPVEKEIQQLPATMPLAERKNMLYMGTAITTGRAVAVVVATGVKTEIGKIAAAVAEQKPEKTPLQKGMDDLGVFTMKFGYGTIALGFAIGLLRGIGFWDILMLSVAAAVSVVPEGLPFAVTAVLSIGMRKMAARNAIVRKLAAVETLGAASVICSDKTGTMTLNQMAVREVYWQGKVYALPSDDKALLDILRIGALCNNSHLVQEKNSKVTAGDPTEGALLLAALASGISKEEAEKEYLRLGEIPFDSRNKWMATLHERSGSRVVYVKGALEKLIEMSSHVQSAGEAVAITDSDRNEFKRVHDQMAQKAMRVLAVGYQDYPSECGSLQEANIKGKLVLCGLFGMIDPPRQEVIKSIADCKKAGIRVVMITGDNAITAAAIGKEIGLDTKEVLTGSELNLLDEKELKEKVREVSVFARIDPLDKLKIVSALQSNDYIVAMTGDGVNDAPALEKADIGVAMGITGTDVAKEASDMVLADDNFTSIVAAIEEGRSIFDHLRNVTAFMITLCLAEVLYWITALIFLGKAPLEPIQILWLNIVAGSIIVIPLGFEPKTKDELSWPPRSKKTNLLYEGMVWRIVAISVFMGLIFVPLFAWCLSRMSLIEARTIIFTADAVFQWVLVFCFRSEQKTFLTLGLFRNKWLILAVGVCIVLQICVNYFQQVHPWFHIVTLQPYQWALVFLPAILLFAATLARKLLLPVIFSGGKWR
jgi:Ca2+-transporting ATPase